MSGPGRRPAASNGGISPAGDFGYSLAELRRHARRSTPCANPIRLALLGDSACQFLAEALQGYAAVRQQGLALFEAGIGQIDSQILNEQSELYRHAPDFIVLLASTGKLHDAFVRTPDPRAFAEHYLATLRARLDAIGRFAPAARLIHANFPELDDGIYGNYSNSVGVSFLYQLRKINLLMMELAQERDALLICDLGTLQNRYGRERFHDPTWALSVGVAYSLNFMPAIARHVFDIVAAVRGFSRKCVVLDLDNTLWGGVLDEDGVENIQLGELGSGRAFCDLQHWLKRLKERGVILAVCSKNDDAVAREPFLTHPEMVLRLEDIAVFVANWQNKVDNIRYIQEVLNIGFDSMVFLDDNPFEREMVAQALPEMTVPALPSDPVHYLEHLQGLNLFEVAAVSVLDANRTLQYQQEALRKQVRAQYCSEQEYLASIHMHSAFRPFSEMDLPRVAQLSQRSNQFNLRTSRYNASEIERIAGAPQYATQAFELCDDYGNYGLVAALVLRREQDTLFIEAWMMSCRILNRGMEYFVLNQIVRLARNECACTIKGEYIPTRKNALVEDLYQRLGFQERGGFWYLPVEGYLMKPTAIAPQSTKSDAPLEESL